jgi:hypothetical protein
MRAIMPTIRAFVTRHAVPAYFALTFAISWGGALLAIGGSGGMRGTTRHRGVGRRWSRGRCQPRTLPLANAPEADCVRRNLTAPSKKLAWFEESGHEPSSMKRPSSTQRRWRWCGHWRPETHNPAPSRLRERKTMRSPMSGASTSFCPSGPVCYGALVTALPV